MTTSELGQGCQFCYLRFIQAANTSTVISYLYIFPATGKVQSKILILKARLNNKDLEKQYDKVQKQYVKKFSSPGNHVE